MRNPNELQVFELADVLAHVVYDATLAFPNDERFGLTQQLRRAAVSVPSNIVEGCSRESQADFRRFIEIATGSAMEVRYQLAFARERGFGHEEPMEKAMAAVEKVTTALIAFGRGLRAQTPNPKPQTLP